MSKSKLLQWLCGLTLVACIPFGPAQAQSPTNFESWVSGTGNDSNACSRTAPCASFIIAIRKTFSGGQVNVMDAGDFGPIYVDRAIAVVNDTSGTVAIANGSSASGGGEVVVAAGNSDIVTLRGLTLNGNNLPAGTHGILITNASQVNIEKCRIINAPGAGIFLAPVNGTTVSKINLKIEDTVVTGSGNGVVISSISGLPVNAAISRSSFQENTGGGIRIDGQSGGPITVSISDSSSSLNASAGLNAVSGAGNVAVDITRAVIASNTTGVQSNQSHGGLVTVTVRGSALLHNVSALVFLGGGTLSSFGDNNIVGTAGTGFSGMTAMQ